MFEKRPDHRTRSIASRTTLVAFPECLALAFGMGEDRRPPFGRGRTVDEAPNEGDLFFYICYFVAWFVGQLVSFLENGRTNKRMNSRHTRHRHYRHCHRGGMDGDRMGG